MSKAFPTYPKGQIQPGDLVQTRWPETFDWDCGVVLREIPLEGGPGEFNVWFFFNGEKKTVCPTDLVPWDGVTYRWPEGPRYRRPACNPASRVQDLMMSGEKEGKR